MNFLLKINDGRYRKTNFAIWSARYASAKTLGREGSISSSRYYSYVFSLIDPVDEFPFKEMSACGHPKISSCLCIWCKSKELGGRGSTRFPTPTVESFSADFLLAMKSYWTESHLEFCQTSTTELLCKNMWSALR